MLKFFSRSRGGSNKEHTPFLSSHIEDPPTVIHDYGTRRSYNQNTHGDGIPVEEEDDNLQYEDEEEEGAGDEDEVGIDADTPLLPIFSSAFLGDLFFRQVNQAASRPLTVLLYR